MEIVDEYKFYLRNSGITFIFVLIFFCGLSFNSISIGQEAFPAVAYVLFILTVSNKSNFFSLVVMKISLKQKSTYVYNDGCPMKTFNAQFLT